MKTRNELHAAAQAKSHTYQPSVTGTREGQTEWPKIVFKLMPIPQGPARRTRMDMGMRTKGKRHE